MILDFSELHSERCHSDSVFLSMNSNIFINGFPLLFSNRRKAKLDDGLLTQMEENNIPFLLFIRACWNRFVASYEWHVATFYQSFTILVY